MHRWIATALLLAACGDNEKDDLFFTYDDRQVLCAAELDDYVVPEHWDRLQERLDWAAEWNWVYDAYAHSPGVTVSIPTLERALDMFDADGLAYLTYRDFDPYAEPRPGIALAFDDNDPDSWSSIRELLQQHHAKVTFFITKYDEFTPEQRAELHTLADDGHDIEAHSMTHANGVDYVAEHGMDAYLDDEVLPSFQILRDDGFSPQSFAYPYGAHTPEMDAAIEPYARYIRATAGDCPH